MIRTVLLTEESKQLTVLQSLPGAVGGVMAGRWPRLARPSLLKFQVAAAFSLCRTYTSSICPWPPWSPFSVIIIFLQTSVTSLFAINLSAFSCASILSLPWCLGTREHQVHWPEPLKLREPETQLEQVQDKQNLGSTPHRGASRRAAGTRSSESQRGPQILSGVFLVPCPCFWDFLLSY